MEKVAGLFNFCTIVLHGTKGSNTKEKWLNVLKNRARRCLMALGSNRKTILGSR
jgi:hypothetical protein